MDTSIDIESDSSYNLRDNSCQGCTFYPHVKYQYQQKVQYDIKYNRND